LRKCPYLIGAPRALRRLKCHSLGNGFNVPARTHCRLAKCRGLMYVPGPIQRCDWPRNASFCMIVPSNDFQAMDFLKPIAAPYLPWYIKPRNFAKRQCKLQWLTPPIGRPTGSETPKPPIIIARKPENLLYPIKVGNAVAVARETQHIDVIVNIL